MRERPDVVVNVVDSTNLERNLYLTIQLLDMGVPIVMALNIIDEAKALGLDIDVEGLSRALGVRVVPTAAVRGQGVGELLDAAFAAISVQSAQVDSPTQNLKSENSVYPGGPSWCDCSPEPHDTAVERRYGRSSEIVRSAVKTTAHSPAESPSQRIDRVVLNPWLAYPVFFGVVWAMFQFTFALSEPIADWLGGVIAAFGSWAAHMLGAAGATKILVAFLVTSLVYMPCTATVAGIRRETGSPAWTAFAMAYPLVLEWTLAVLVYQVGRLIGLA